MLEPQNSPTPPSHSAGSALHSVTIAAQAADDIKGQDIVALQVRDLTTIADYFLLVTATSSTQVQAIHQSIDEAMSKHGREPLHVEGKTEGHWILMDYADVIIHIFLADQRAFYGLERLWGDAPQVHLNLNPRG